jgi:hypothetical protein
VFTTSTDGVTWSAVQRVAADPTSSTVDHFIPGIAVDPTTSGATGRVAVAYYYYPTANCTVATCQLFVGFSTSTDGGATWSANLALAGPMLLTWLAQTSQGRMVGDYISTSFSGGSAHPIFAIANAPQGTVFDEKTATAGIDVAALTRSGTVGAGSGVVRSTPRAVRLPARLR